MDAEAGSRALSAANDLVELLRLTQGALERIEREVQLQADIERFVSREESATVWRGHPLRRSADRAAPPGTHR
jgi:hypothetical protein